MENAHEHSDARRIAKASGHSPLPADLWPDVTGLSPRECEIVRLVANDRTNKQIALTLGISVWTVSTHLRRIFAKLSVHSRAAMVATVLRSIRDPLD